MASTAFNMNAASLTQIWNFPKLKGQENYQPWSKKMKSALEFSGLWDIVEQGPQMFPDDLPKGQTDAQGRVTRGPTEGQVRKYDSNLKEWNTLNSQASELIYSMCEEKPAEAIKEEEIATNRWHKLERDYVNSGFVLRSIKLQELWATTLASSNNSIEVYVANIRTKSKDLKRMGAPIADWILVALLLNNLGTKFKDFLHRLVTQFDDVPDFDRIVTLLHVEERLIERYNKESATTAAMKRFQEDQEKRKNSVKVLGSQL